MKFVVADDHPTIREIVRAILKTLGHAQVELAAHGDEAFGMIQMNRPDVVISDIDMPRRNGLELLRDVRTGQAGVDPATPFLLLTGHADNGLVGTALALDVSAFLVKPVSPPGLKRRLERVLEQRLAPKPAAEYARVNVQQLAGGPLSTLGADRPRPLTAAARLPIAQLSVGMVLTEAVNGKTGAQVLAAGTAVSTWLLDQLRDLLEIGAIEDGIAVRRP
jgi:CheY-like chemotaxis protein